MGAKRIGEVCGVTVKMEVVPFSWDGAGTGAGVGAGVSFERAACAVLLVPGEGSVENISLSVEAMLMSRSLKRKA